MTTRRQLLAGIGAGTIAASFGIKHADAATAYMLSRQFEADEPGFDGPFIYLCVAGFHETKEDAKKIHNMLSKSALDTFAQSFAQSGIYMNGSESMDFSKDGEYEDVLDGTRRTGWTFDMKSDGFNMEGIMVLTQKHQVNHIWAATGLAMVEDAFLDTAEEYMKFDATTIKLLSDDLPGAYDLDGFTMTKDELGPVEDDEWL